MRITALNIWLIFNFIFLCDYYSSAQMNKASNSNNKFEKLNKLIKKNKFNEALMLVDQMIENDSTKSEYYFNKGLILAEIGEINKSILNMNKAYQLNSYNFSALYYLGTYHTNELLGLLEANASDSVIYEQASLAQEYFEKYYSIVNDTNAAIYLRNIYQLVNKKDYFIDSVNQVFNPESKYYIIEDSIRDIAQFPKGEAAMYRFIGSNINMPMEARTMGINGRVLVSFIVDEKGHIEHIRIFKSLIPACDAEVIRVLRLMPDWVPAKDLNSNSIKTVYRMPIKFTVN